MSRARKSILLDGDIAHIMWRTAHKEFLLKQQKHKDLFVKILVKYKNKYKIKILERTIMDNHIHFIVKIDKLNNFLNFMRDVNSVFAKKLNQDLKRCGNVIMDRYKSPVVQSMQYLKMLIMYIWLNHIQTSKASIKDIINNHNCSIYYRIRGLKDPMCDSYEEFFKDSGIINPCLNQSEKNFCFKLLHIALTQFLFKVVDTIFDHLHSIGDELFIKIRKIKTNIPIFKNYFLLSQTISTVVNIISNPSG